MEASTPFNSHKPPLINIPHPVRQIRNRIFEVSGSRLHGYIWVTYLAEGEGRSRRRLLVPSTEGRGCTRCSPSAGLHSQISPGPSGSSIPCHSHREQGPTPEKHFDRATSSGPRRFEVGCGMKSKWSEWSDERCERPKRSTWTSGYRNKTQIQGMSVSPLEKWNRSQSDKEIPK